MPKDTSSRRTTGAPRKPPKQQLALLGKLNHSAISQDFLKLSAELSKGVESLTAFFAQQAADWAALSAAVSENLKSMNTALEKSEWLGRLGWTLPMNATSAELSDLLEEITDEASADVAFVEHFTANGQERLNQLVAGTLENPSLRYWKPTLEEALWCLSHRKYRVCTTALLPILDGLCSSQFGVPQFHAKRNRKRYLDERRRHAMANKSVTKWIWLSFIGFCETLLQEVDFSGPNDPPRVLNRHAILHGRDVPAARLEDCIRLLLALDMITALSDEAVWPRTKHVPQLKPQRSVRG